MTLSEVIVADFKDEVAHTEKMLAAVPDDKWDWKPHEKSMSLAELTGHIAETPGWIGGMMQDEVDFDASMDEWKPFVPENRDQLLETFQEGAAQFIETVSGQDDAFMTGTWTAKSGEKVLMSLPKHTAIRSTGIHHLIHHRAQLNVYLRLLGVPVLATYGPTADFPDFF